MERTPLFLQAQGHGWHLRPGRNALVAGAALVFAAILGAVAISAWRQEKYAAAALLAVVAAGFLGLAVPWRRRRPPRLVEDESGRGLLLPLGAPGPGPTLGALVIGPLLVLGGVVGLVDGQWGGLVAVLAGGVVLLGLYAALRATRIEDRGVALVPDGIVVRTSRTPVRLAWSDVTGVRAHWRRRVRGLYPTPDEPVHNWLTFEVAGTGQGVSIDPTTFACDPELALAVIRHYLDHPDDRAELGTERSLLRAAHLQDAEVGTPPG